jgi:asparagine synthase (glutamine-hydrolysing)
MCGICGAISLDGRRRVHEEALRRMNEAMTHRGPNDAGLWNGGHVGLAMRRLSIIDLFRGHQPMISADGSIVVVFNGEIYNFKRLREELEDAGAEFHTTSDTEVILHGYAV